MGFFQKPVLDISQRLDTPDVCGLSKFISAADIQQLVDLLRPGDNMGMVWVSSATPDIATYPELKNFLWIDLSTGGFPYAMRVFNWDMNSWDVLRQADGTVSGEVLADRSIKVVKLLPDPGTAGQVIVVNADSTKFVYVWAKDAIADKTLELNKLKVPKDTANGSYLTHVGDGVLGFSVLTTAQINTLIQDGTITISKLSTAGALKAGDLIRVSTDLKKFEFYSPSAGVAGPAIPTPDQAHAGQLLKVDTATPWTYVLSPVSSILPLAIQSFASKVSGVYPMPTSPSSGDVPTPISWTHGLGKAPTGIRTVLIAKAGSGYTVGDEIDATCCTGASGNPYLVTYVTGTAGDTIKVIKSHNQGMELSTPLHASPNSATDSNFDIKIYAWTS